MNLRAYRRCIVALLRIDSIGLLVNIAPVAGSKRFNFLICTLTALWDTGTATGFTRSRSRHIRTERTANTWSRSSGRYTSPNLDPMSFVLAILSDSWYASRSGHPNLAKWLSETKSFNRSFWRLNRRRRLMSGISTVNSVWMGGISSTNSPRSTTLYLRRARVVECFRSENLLKNRFYGQEQEPNVSRQNAYYSVQCNNQPISPCLVHNPVNLIKNKGEQWIIGWFPVEFLQKCFQSRYGVSKLSHRKMVSINAECVLENMALSKQWRKVASIA